jgi:hypothetical protein
VKSEDVKNCNLDRIYRINFVDFGCGFVPGRNEKGDQILMGDLVRGPDDKWEQTMPDGRDIELLITIFFSKDGHYKHYEFRPFFLHIARSKLIGQEVFRHAEELQKAKQEWIKELGMTPGDIYIRHFAFPEWGIGIAEWPAYLFPEVQHALAAGEPFENERLIDWQREKRWVFFWNNDYWMYENGEIGDS